MARKQDKRAQRLVAASRKRHPLRVCSKEAEPGLLRKEAHRIGGKQP